MSLPSYAATPLIKCNNKGNEHVCKKGDAHPPGFALEMFLWLEVALANAVLMRHQKVREVA
jgi:hypothetical protein